MLKFYMEFPTLDKIGVLVLIILLEKMVLYYSGNRRWRNIVEKEIYEY
jgi:hypothetical protein